MKLGNYLLFFRQMTASDLLRQIGIELVIRRVNVGSKIRRMTGIGLLRTLRMFGRGRGSRPSLIVVGTPWKNCFE